MEKLIHKYFENTLSKSGHKKLKNILKKEENKKLFIKRIQEQFDLSVALHTRDMDIEYNQLQLKIKQNTPKRKLLSSISYRVAAVFIGLIALSYFYINFHDKQDLKFDKNAIILTLEDGTVKLIKKGGNEQVFDAQGAILRTQKGYTLAYNRVQEFNNSSDKNTVLKYNELYIPYGKTFKLLLSDGSRLHLNAGTRIKYPINFIKNKPRTVFLNGEALFEVAKKKTTPFIVAVSELNVRVLGTKFAINAYDEDKNIQTVLIEGSVGLYKSTENFDIDRVRLLQPKQLASWNKEDKKMMIHEVDTREYTAWTKGKLLFKIRPFSEIIKVLERRYDVSIKNNYKKLNKQRFFAKFDTETIEEILISFQQSEMFDYKINENKIIINPPKNKANEIKNKNKNDHR